MVFMEAPDIEVAAYAMDRHPTAFDHGSRHDEGYALHLVHDSPIVPCVVCKNLCGFARHVTTRHMLRIVT